MNMHQIILLFICSTRQSDWLLHLNSWRQMVPYFFAYDQQNYARLTCTFIWNGGFKKNDPDTWTFCMEGHFSLYKSGVSFTAIVADYALEQEKKYKSSCGSERTASK